jgi:3-dehydroquinate synthetase
MAGFQLNCRNLVILLGGGVVSDIVGFIAATYKRGIDY